MVRLGLEPKGRQDGRCRRVHWAITTPPLFIFQPSSLICKNGFLARSEPKSRLFLSLSLSLSLFLLLMTGTSMKAREKEIESWRMWERERGRKMWERERGRKMWERERERDLRETFLQRRLSYFAKSRWKRPPKTTTTTTTTRQDIFWSAPHKKLKSCWNDVCRSMLIQRSPILNLTT